MIKFYLDNETLKFYYIFILNTTLASGTVPRLEQVLIEGKKYEI